MKNKNFPKKSRGGVPEVQDGTNGRYFAASQYELSLRYKIIDV